MLKQRVQVVHSLYRNQSCSFTDKKRPIEKNGFVLIDSPLNCTDPNSLISDVKEEDLKGAISTLLQAPYLARCIEDEKQIFLQEQFLGIRFGTNSRMFVSIPTRLNINHPFRYVHYMIAPGSPYTTLTHKALQKLQGKEYSASLGFKSRIFQIGPFQVDVQLSNSNLGVIQTSFHNMNKLGMNFFQKCNRYSINAVMKNNTFKINLH